MERLNCSSGPEIKLLTVQAAAEFLKSLGASVSVHFVRVLIADGEIAFVKMGRRFYITREALETWIQNHNRRRKCS